MGRCERAWLSGASTGQGSGSFSRLRRLRRRLCRRLSAAPRHAPAHLHGGAGVQHLDALGSAHGQAGAGGLGEHGIDVCGGAGATWRKRRRRARATAVVDPIQTYARASAASPAPLNPHGLPAPPGAPRARREGVGRAGRAPRGRPEPWAWHAAPGRTLAAEGDGGLRLASGTGARPVRAVVVIVPVASGLRLGHP